MNLISGDSLRGHLESLILSDLRRKEAHGFEILRRLDEASTGVLKLKEGSLYPALNRLENSGLIDGEWEDGSIVRRGPRRKIYRITPKGQRKLVQARITFNQFAAVIGGILEIAS